ncbi:hypothetical protein DAEQUDRAFT_259170 [Daedalea quercina L-15889]|uniref:Uncharacterized protein n=1 Tax=Daedalea quercina L-15889 TaxID=1314783 RepID=A0A165QKQ7_9APHY|nr:hypothetical protein DAEQUDRAFT_259170 [Daedalea quercina L-15889]
MASLASVTRQLGALEISSKPNTARPTHEKKPSQSKNVSQLLSKFAAPNPFPSKTAIPKKPTQASLTSKQPTRPPSPSKPTAAAAVTKSTQPVIDIGRYDGGLELDNESRGECVHGEAAETLALDSSVSQ